MAALPKVKRKLKSAVYENAKFGSKTSKTNDEETQENYEEIDISAIQINQDNNDRLKAQPNEYLNWDDRKRDNPIAKNDQSILIEQRQNCTLQDLKLPERKYVTTKWKIITIISVMVCIGGTSGLIAVLVVRLSPKVFPCSESRCLNNGTCVVIDDEAVCTCVNGFYGAQCEITPCSTYPCLNGGYCSVIGGAYTCTCPQQLTGQRCEVTPCSNSSCQNDGTCFFHQMESRCACQNGFMGERCELTPCSLNPCLNGGNCSVSGSEYNCTCPLAVSGKRCEVTPCSSNPCVNGGNCSFNGSRYICACPTARSGTRCEASTEVFKTIQSPGFPEQYTNSLSQTWNIDVGNGYIAVLSFNYFNTEPCCDFIYVCNGYSSCNQPLFNGSGLSLPSDVRATGQYMFIQFKTDGSVTKQGFLGVIFKK